MSLGKKTMSKKEKRYGDVVEAEGVEGWLRYLDKMEGWINLERDEEVMEMTQATSGMTPGNLQKLGLALLSLRITRSRTGLGGKTIVDVEQQEVGSKLPPHQFRTGDVVAMNPMGSGGGSNLKRGGAKPSKDSQVDADPNQCSGVVLRATDTKLVIALDDASLALEPQQLSGFWRITQLANEVTYKRMLRVINDIQDVLKPSGNKGSNPAKWSGNMDLLPLLLNSKPLPTKLSFDSDMTLDKIKFFDAGLNSSQKEAIRFSLAAHQIALIHGPPGTGKTHTLVELVRQLVAKELRVLVCGPSNAAVGQYFITKSTRDHYLILTGWILDNMLERLVPHGLKCLRLGHPGRVQLPHLVDKVLDVQLRYSDAGMIVRDIRLEMDTTLQSISKCKSRAERRDLYQQLSELRKDYRVREARATQELLMGAQVTLSTLNGCGGRILSNQAFDVLIIDEATQALEPECWLGISKCQKVILAGDHHQLPPTIKSSNPHLECTLFQKLIERYNRGMCRMLTVQYRMHQKIMDFSALQLYHGELQPHESVANHLLKDLPYLSKQTDGPGDEDELTSLPLVFLDTAGSDLYESTEDTSNTDNRLVATGSKWNAGEVQLVQGHLTQLIDSGLKVEDIAIISPYNAQVHQLQRVLRPLFPQLEIGSVDGFQGREKEAIIVSLVRSNAEGTVGFLKDYRRLNVALTRARRHLCLVGDSATVMVEDRTNTKAKEGDKDNKKNVKPPHDNFLIELGTYLTDHADLWVPEMYL